MRRRSMTWAVRSVVAGVGAREIAVAAIAVVRAAGQGTVAS
jgi:hypothetical protein